MDYVIPTGLNQVNDPYQIEELIDSKMVQVLKANYDLLYGQARDFFSNPQYAINAQIGFQANEAAMLDQAYFMAQFDITISNPVGGPGGFLTATVFPQLLEKMMTNLVINTNSFSSSINASIPGRTIPLWSLIQRLQQYSPNDMALNAQIEKLQVQPGSSVLQDGLGGFEDSPNGGYIWSNGTRIFYNISAPTTKTVTLYQKVPISKILPLAERIHLISGTLGFQFNLNYIKDILVSPTTVEGTSNGSVITGFKLSRLQFYVDKLLFSKPDLTLDIRRLKSVDVKIQNIPATYSLTIPGTGPFAPGTLSTRVSFTLQAISGSIFKCMVAPYIDSVVNLDANLVTSTGYDRQTYKLQDYIIKPAIPGAGFTLTGNNVVKCLGAMFNIYDAKIDIGGIVLPEPNPVLFTTGPEASAVQYIQSFVQNLGLRTDGGSSRSCFPLSLWNDYLKVLVVDLENATKFNPNNINLTVSFSITNAFDLVAPNAGSINIGFDAFTTHIVEYANI